MFWGSFSYDRYGPCHIWRPETKQEKELTIKKLKIMNSYNNNAHWFLKQRSYNGIKKKRKTGKWKRRHRLVALLTLYDTS